MRIIYTARDDFNCATLILRCSKQDPHHNNTTIFATLTLILIIGESDATLPLAHCHECTEVLSEGLVIFLIQPGQRAELGPIVPLLLSVGGGRVVSVGDVGWLYGVMGGDGVVVDG